MPSRTPTTGPRAVGDEAREFMAGGLRDRLGLEPATLAVGRTIAEGHMRRGALPEALRLFGALALCEPANAEVQLRIAECAVRLEAFELGVGAAQIAAASAPLEPRAHLLLGHCRLALGDRVRSRRALERALELGLDRRDAHTVEAARKLLSFVSDDSDAAPARGDRG